MGEIWESTGETETQAEGETLRWEHHGIFQCYFLYQEALARFISICSVFDARDILLASGPHKIKHILFIF